MSARRRLRTLPIRGWLALALVAVFLVPAHAIVITWGIVASHQTEEVQSAGDMAAERLREDVSQWNDPTWQAAIQAELALEGVDFVLFENGREVYRSADDPVAGQSRLVQPVVIPGAESERIAYVYADQDDGSSQQARFWQVPLVGVAALLLTVGGIAWFLGRTVVDPLGATSRAAQRVAVGNLDVELPSSRVREVAEVNAAFEAMSAGLRASVHHEAEMDQQRRIFIGAVVHDLRTPLFSLRGYLEGFEKGLADTPEKRARYIAVAQEKAAALERLVTDLFDYTRHEYLEQAPNREPLDLGALLRRLVDGLQPQAEAKGVELALEGSPGACVVDGDSHLLTRAVENLLDNALRHTPSGGSVRVACHSEGDAVLFSVSDTGPGIPARDLPNLFTPMYRGEISRNRRTGGAGLGLTIARKILLAHGGDLTAGNGGSGGAVFAGSLPRSVDQERDGKDRILDSA